MILDTCALLWLAQGGGDLSDEARRRIDAAPVVWVPAISAFEIAVKAGSGKLELPTPPRDWWTATIEHHGLSVVAITDDVCLKAAELPPVHRDPVDRIIVAIGLLRDEEVVTGDRRFREYGVRTVC